MPLIAGENSKPVPLSSGGSRPSHSGGGGEGGVIQTLLGGKGKPGLKKKNFVHPFGLQFGLKIREGGSAPPMDPPLLSDSPDDVNWQ